MDREKLNLEKIRISAFPDWSLAMHLEAWRKSYKGKRIKAGTPFLAPDGQLFVVTGRLFWRRSGKKRPDISLIWQSCCQLCQAPYTFNVPYHATRMVRTCTKHRGKAPRAKKAYTPTQSLILATLIDPALQLLGMIDHESFIAQCAAQMSYVGGRDTRKQRARQAMQALIDKGAWPADYPLTAEHVLFCK